MPHAWRHLDGYDASDSEHEQLDWRGQLGDVGRYTGERASQILAAAIPTTIASRKGWRPSKRSASAKRGASEDHVIAEVNARNAKAAVLSARCSVCGTLV